MEVLISIISVYLIWITRKNEEGLWHELKAIHQSNSKDHKKDLKELSNE